MQFHYLHFLHWIVDLFLNLYILLLFFIILYDYDRWYNWSKTSISKMRYQYPKWDINIRDDINIRSETSTSEMRHQYPKWNIKQRRRQLHPRTSRNPFERAYWMGYLELHFITKVFHFSGKHFQLRPFCVMSRITFRRRTILITICTNYHIGIKNHISNLLLFVSKNRNYLDKSTLPT